MPGTNFGVAGDPLLNIGATRQFSHTALSQFANNQPYGDDFYSFQNLIARVARYVEIPTIVYGRDFDRVEIWLDDMWIPLELTADDIVLYAGDTGTRFWYDVVFAQRNRGNLLQWIPVEGIDALRGSTGLDINFQFLLGDNPNPIAVAVDTIPAITVLGWVEFTANSGASSTDAPTTVNLNSMWSGTAVLTTAIGTTSNLMATFSDYLNPATLIPNLQPANFRLNVLANDYRMLVSDLTSAASSLSDIHNLAEAVRLHIEFERLLVGQTPVLGGTQSTSGLSGEVVASITDDGIFPNTVIEFRAISTTPAWTQAMLLYQGNEGSIEYIYNVAQRRFIGRTDGFNGDWSQLDWNNGGANLVFFATAAGTYEFELTLREVTRNSAGNFLYPPAAGQTPGQILAQQTFSIEVQPNAVASLTDIAFERPSSWTDTRTHAVWVTERRASITEWLNTQPYNTVGERFLPQGVRVADMRLYESNTGTERTTSGATWSDINFTVRIDFTTDDNTVFVTAPRTPATAMPLMDDGSTRRSINQGNFGSATDVTFADLQSGLEDRDYPQISNLTRDSFSVTFRFDPK
jgi:hypothetical protein